MLLGDRVRGILYSCNLHSRSCVIFFQIMKVGALYFFPSGSGTREGENTREVFGFVAAELF